jgi:hypothetical protein
MRVLNIQVTERLKNFGGGATTLIARMAFDKGMYRRLIRRGGICGRLRGIRAEVPGYVIEIVGGYSESCALATGQCDA